VFPLFGLPFVALALWGLSSPWRDARRAPKTPIAVTNSRLLILSEKGRGITTEVIPPSSIGSVQRVDHADGTGSVEITLTTLVAHGEGQTNRKVFIDGIADAKAAQAAIHAMKG
jgi:hypothetical protein